jgi:hypothetical protein
MVCSEEGPTTAASAFTFEHAGKVKFVSLTRNQYERLPVDERVGAQSLNREIYPNVWHASINSVSLGDRGRGIEYDVDINGSKGSWGALMGKSERDAFGSEIFF